MVPLWQPNWTWPSTVILAGCGDAVVVFIRVVNGVGTFESWHEEPRLEP